MRLQEKITNDWKIAMKARELRKDILAYIRSEIKTRAINDRSDSEDVADGTVFIVLKNLAKQRKEAMLAMAHRPDLAQKEKAELDIINSYLSQRKMLSPLELDHAVDTIISEAGADSNDFGKVMGALMARHKGEIDGKQAQEVVRLRLETPAA